MKPIEAIKREMTTIINAIIGGFIPSSGFGKLAVV
jgi:hypothetical protein